ncbi:hypothetical protein TrVFT333_006824 [Trichoderma virens FT-333]|nr:hypothetical protein TrVFT333_006824 [Trichoderma virens FT-333]
MGASIFATSRSIPEVTDKFDRSTWLEIRASDDDIRSYVDAQISQGESTTLRDMQAEASTGIMRAADGMFLLAKLDLDSLLDAKLPRDIRTKLKNLPKGSKAYSQAYEEIMKRIEHQGPETVKFAKTVLSWITCAKRPLTIPELRHALAVEIGGSRLNQEDLPQVQDLISVCAGLVTVEEDCGIIRLFHYTAQEYFEQTQKQWFPDAGDDITRTCVTYLSFDDFEAGFCPTDAEFEERLRSYQLYDYAAHRWGHHARETANLDPLVLDFLQYQAKVEASSQALFAAKESGKPQYSQNVPKQMMGLHLAAYFGIEKAVRIPLDLHGWDPEDGYNRTPLSWAAENGHEAVVRLLLNKGANPQATDHSGLTPFSWAIRGGHEAIVRLLSTNINVESANTDGQIPLLSAVGHSPSMGGADPEEETQPTDRSEDQSQTETPPSAKTDITRGQVEIKHVYIAVIGGTGAGKSSFISLCAGKNVQIGHELKSCTTDVEDVEFMLNDRVCIHLIDTPGFDNTNRSDVQVLQDIAYWLSISFKQGTKLSGIIFLHRITDVRITGSTLRQLLIFKKLCGEKVYSSVVLATSMWGRIDEATGAQRERELTETKGFWGYMHEKGSHIFRLAQTRESCLSIIRHILSFDSTIILKLQDEIVNQGRQIEDIEAGMQLNGDIIRERKKHQAELQDLKRQMQEKIVQHDAELQRVLKEECDKLEEATRRNNKEQAKLKQDLKDVHECKDREFLELKKQMESDIGRERKKYEDNIEKLNRNQKEALERQAKEYEDRIHRMEKLNRNQKEALEQQAKEYEDRIHRMEKLNRNQKEALEQQAKEYEDRIHRMEKINRNQKEALERQAKEYEDRIHRMEKLNRNQKEALEQQAKEYEDNIEKLNRNQKEALERQAKEYEDRIHRMEKLNRNQKEALEQQAKEYEDRIHRMEKINRNQKEALERQAKEYEDRIHRMEKLNRNQKEALEQQAKEYEDNIEKLNRNQKEALERQAKEYAEREKKHVYGDDTPLHEAARNGKADVVKLLLGQGANIEAKNNDGNTPLHDAARNGKADVTKLLLARGANIEAKNNDIGDTPLHLAAWNGKADMVKFLLDHRANIEAKDNSGNTPLRDAAWNGKADVAKLLLARGANIEAKQNDNGDTPLHLAAWHGKADMYTTSSCLEWGADMVELLLNRGANIEAKNNSGNTPLYNATRNGKADVVKLLRDRGARG